MDNSTAEPSPEPSKEQRTWATIAHLSALAYYFSGIGHLVAPLLIWILKREGNPFVDAQAKEALNFQISLTIYAIVSIAICFTIILAPIGLPVLFGLHIFQLICVIMAAVKSNEGIPFRYPLNLRLIK